MVTVVHNYEQLMAWKSGDVQALVGKHIRVEEADERTYWTDPHCYAGTWALVAEGTVDAGQMNTKGESVDVRFVNGGGVHWILGQPIRVLEVA